jgi:hypothetical protein
VVVERKMCRLSATVDARGLCFPRIVSFSFFFFSCLMFFFFPSFFLLRLLIVHSPLTFLIRVFLHGFFFSFFFLRLFA